MITDRPARDPVPSGVPDRRRTVSAGRTALVLGALGVAYRAAALLAGLPPTNSDEAVTGLVATHVAQAREFPLFFYGQHYMGALEAYLAAGLFALTGPGLVALRLPNLVLYALFLVLMWQLTRRLYHPWFATAVVGLLALGSDRILKNQLIAAGGYPEMNPAGALLVLLAVLLGLGAVRRRAPAFAAFGLVAGLTLWDDWLVLPYVAAAGLLLLAGAGRDLAGRGGAALAAGLAVGLLPIVAHNLTAAPEHRSLAAYRQLGGGTPGDWTDRLHGGVLFGLPMGTGFCAPSRCADWQLWWGAVAPLLLLLAGLLALRALWGLRPAPAGDAAIRTALPDDAAIRTARIRQGGRLALVGAAAVSLAAYAGSAAAGTTPVESSRYLSCLLVSLPALLWPLWSAARAHPGRLPAGLRRLGRAGLAAVAGSALLATGTLVTEADDLTRADDRRHDLVAALDRLGIRHFYTDYWTCYPIVFASRERLACGVIRDDLRAGWDRHPAYPARVAGADRVAYVLPAGTALSRAVADWLAVSGTPVTRTTVPGYDIHLPAAPVGLPLR
ncbi:4-amino-4-deoxy-L-arabinose transferase [Micromonospora inyonensis]|uniref:4-amino-4-deoxy-L-arabinose transferase n=1 Tax=Micromonospora inyonensis TaxID=47866 RepID=A0A1C6RS72_9ACTN|nr:4-amino-4-deoxy-L-arabinose transferase [Micromonospora inyonensis]